MLACPRCAAELPAGSGRCPECGHDLRPQAAVPPASPSGMRVAGGLGCVIIGALLALLGVVLVFGMLAGGLLG